MRIPTINPRTVPMVSWALVCVALAIASLLFALNARDAARDAALVHSVCVVIDDKTYDILKERLMAGDAAEGN